LSVTQALHLCIEPLIEGRLVEHDRHSYFNAGEDLATACDLTIDFLQGRHKIVPDLGSRLWKIYQPALETHVPTTESWSKCLCYEGSERVGKKSSALSNRIDVHADVKVVYPWNWPWWRTRRHDAPVFVWVILVHITAIIGLILFPLPSWRIALGALALAWLGGIGTTVCYHRSMAHRAVSLNGGVRTFLTLLALANGSGAPLRWVANHRLHHAKVDTDFDITSPRHGFFWSHLRSLWQSTEPPPIARYCPEFDRANYRIFNHLQIPILLLSYLGGLYWSWSVFFWLGAIRLVFALHAQCFVNSVCHTEPDIAPGDDSSRNVRWLGLMQLFLGENWHRNHHARAGSARLGWTWSQPDVGYLIICALEHLGVATEVRHLREERGVGSEAS